MSVPRSAPRRFAVRTSAFTAMAPKIYIFRISELASILDAFGEYYDITARNIKSSLEPDPACRVVYSGVGVPAFAQYNSGLMSIAKG